MQVVITGATGNVGTSLIRALADADEVTSVLWQLRLVPASPHLVDAVLRLPPMATDRARRELGWEPRHSAQQAILEFLQGVRVEAGMPTPPLAPGARARVLPNSKR
jgi:nucleoside-diphosphate-sugar epimerase